MNQETIFVVDDNPTNLNILFDHLEMSHYRVMGSISGELALEAIPQVHPDLILLDIMMPGIDGFETCRRLKANPETRDIPVIFITALSDTSDEVKGLEIGAVDYITKPIKIEMVLARVRTHLALRRMQRQVEQQNLQLQEEIAERKRIENILRKYERIVSATPDFISLIDRDYRYQIANAAYLHAIDKSHEELIGHSIGEFVGQRAFEARTKPRLDRCLAGETIHYETWLSFEKTGRLFLSITYSPYVEFDKTITGVVISTRNITQVKQTQVELEESEERYRRLVEMSPDGIMVHQNERFVYINSAGRNILKAQPPETLIGKPVWDVVHPDYHAVVKERIRQNYEEEKSADFTEIQLIQLDGHIIDAEVASTPTMHHGTLAMQTVFLDITERKRMENALRESERRLADIIDFLPDATLVIDQTGKVIAWNKAMETMTDVKASEMIGKGNYEYALPFYGERRPILIDLVTMPREELEKTYHLITRQGGVLNGEAYMPHLKGGGIYLFGAAAALYDSQGNWVGAIESVRDLTERKHAEEALRASEERFRAVFENVVVGVTVTDSRGRLLQANRCLCDMLGYEADELLQCTTLTITHPDDVAVSREKLHALFRGEIGSYQIEKRYLRKDGSPFWAHLSVSPIRDRDGRVVFTNGMIVDITERKEAEEQLRAAHRELSEKNTQLHELNVSKDKFFSIIAHDLRSPFNALLGYTELVNDQFEMLSQAKLKEYLAKLQLSAERLYALLENLLTWSRIQRGVMEYSPEYVALTTLAADNITLFMSNAERKQLTLTSSIQENVKVYADYAMANTVLRNLISNALKFTPTGGTIDISARQCDRHVEITVSDSGVGMNAETMSKLFRIDAQHTTIGTSGERGTGLGLLLCHDLVKKNGGEIWVESEIGKGTTFRFTIPLSLNVLTTCE